MNADERRSALIRVRPRPNLHCLLFLRKVDVHLLKRDLVERAGHLETFRLLILPQSIPRRIVKLAYLVTRVETTLFENGLRLVDLILSRTENRASFDALLGRGLCCG